MSTPDLSWYLVPSNRIGIAMLPLSSTKLRRCATLAEGVSEATRAIVVAAAGLGGPSKGIVICNACTRFVAISGLGREPDGWCRSVDDAADCPSCAAAAAQLGAGRRRPVPRKCAGEATARAALDVWCRRVLRGGGFRRVELRVSLVEDDGGAAGFDVEVRLLGACCGDVWRATFSRAGAAVDAEEAIQPGDARGFDSWEALDDRARWYVQELEATAVEDSAAGCTLRGGDLLAAAGEVDDVVYWEPDGGPFFAEPNAT